MDPGQRTTDLYEHIEGYPQPELIALPEPGDLNSLYKEGLKPTRLSRMLLRGAMRATGFSAFQRGLSDNLEGLLRRTNLRLPGLFAPTISATLSLADDPRHLTPFERAASLILGARDFYQDVMSGKLPPDTYQGAPLEMGQYPNFFSTSIVFNGSYPAIFKSKEADQVLVLVAGHFFLLRVASLKGAGSVARLAASLQAIVDAAQSKGQRHPASPAILTGASTKTQRKAFPILMQDASNLANLTKLRHTFLTVCLDLEESPATYADAARLAHSQNAENRWHHASLQLVVFGNAKASAICNFTAYLDGNTMMRGGAEIQKRAASLVIDHAEAADTMRLPMEYLDWKISQALMLPAREDLAFIQDAQQATFEIPAVGADCWRGMGLQPVAIFVVAVQMATLRLLDEPVKVEQFLAMSKFRCMDLATAMVTTPEVMACAEYLNGDEAQPTQAMALLRAACDSQLAAAREVRRELPLMMLFALFTRTQGRFKRIYVYILTLFTVFWLRALRLLEATRSFEVVLSQPSIFPEIPVVGRPGIRLPYLKYFGLHYQIHPNHIVISVMPAVDFHVDNVELVAEIERSLNEIKRMCESIAREDKALA